MHTESQEKDKGKIWLQKLKDESWEAELLISTVAIFGTLQLFKLVSYTVDVFIDVLPPDQHLFGFGAVIIGLLAVNILTTMFVIHFLMRAYWVGLVGLNSVFPDYSLEDSAYSEIYTSKMLRILPKLKNTIQQVDELCSVIFSAAFLIFGMYAYLFVLSFVLLKLYGAFGEYIPAPVRTVLMILFFALVVFQLILSVVANLKPLKENARIQNLYFEVIKWGAIILMGPLYKLMMQIAMTFGTNFKKKKALIGINICFLVIGCLITGAQLENTKIPYLVNQDFYFNESKVYGNYYRTNFNKEDFLLAPQIDAEIIESRLVKLFVPLYEYEHKILDKIYGKFVDPGGIPEKERGIMRRAWYVDRYNKYHKILLNGIVIKPLFIRYNLPETGQLGIVAYVNLDSLAEGKNSITVIKQLGKNTREWTIPFQYLIDK